nr:hypothetical protein Iba_chr03cCG8980 [Ipomoea batatas]
MNLPTSAFGEAGFTTSASGRGHVHLVAPQPRVGEGRGRDHSASTESRPGPQWPRSTTSASRESPSSGPSRPRRWPRGRSLEPSVRLVVKVQLFSVRFRLAEIDLLCLALKTYGTPVVTPSSPSVIENSSELSWPGVIPLTVPVCQAFPAKLRIPAKDDCVEAARTHRIQRVSGRSWRFIPIQAMGVPGTMRPDLLLFILNSLAR